ncbi:MAG: folate/biopterin family MFS transporter [Betaproteobacteria bacterium]|nr:folate/biopterin family MFS transporter [Betaproteobacteria bacterium]
MRLSYLPPLMVYAAAGVSGLTGIVGAFYVKERLGLSAEFLAALGFWAGLPWALKMPLGHLVDLMWRWKSLLVYLGAGLIAASLLIMVGLLGDPSRMTAVMPVETWYVLAVLLAPIGYVVQDVVADAMTVEAVPRHDASGVPLADDLRRLMHTTMQTLGRVAIIGGTLLVAGANVVLLAGVADLPEAGKAEAYRFIYELALVIPVLSVAGVLLATWIRHREGRRLAGRGLTGEEIAGLVERRVERPAVNWWILGGGLVFAAVSVSLGVGKVAYAQELVFAASMAIVIFLISRLVRELDPRPRNVLVGTAIVIFVFRALPGPGAGATWWFIDELRFDQQFLATLSLITSTLTLAGMFIFRRFMAERSIVYIVGFLTVAGTALALPTIGMYYGLHEWTAARTGGVVDARFIAIVDTALESPLGQIAMIPMLAWIANSAPERLKATFFAVMASFTNLALSASQLGTRYLNGVFTVTREVKDRATGAIATPADYGELGMLLITITAIGFAAPFVAILLIRLSRFRSA